ncbi:MAG: type II and III secretion system protein [Verrucomicrobium sp.]|nr:type II and III secretion system protein [Verrucomicrobium sp.]
MNPFLRRSLASLLFLSACSGLFAQESVVASGEAAAGGQTKEIAKVQQAEQLRKQQAVLRITPTLDNAAALERTGAYAKAQVIYLAALRELTPAPATQAVYEKAKNGLFRCDAYLIDEARKKGDWATMESLLNLSLNYAPDDPKLKAALAKVKAARTNPQDTTLLANPAVNAPFQNQVEAASNYLAQAEQARRTGQYELAEDRLNKLLGIDPYNNAAQQMLKQITEEKLQYQAVATEQNRKQRLKEVEQKWSNPPPKPKLEVVAATAAVPMTRSNDFDINRKLESIVIPSVEFSDASLQNAVDFLNDKTRQLDPEHEGINFIPRPEALSQAKTITLSLKNVPLKEVLRYLTQLAQVKFKIDPSAVFFVPLSEPTDVLVRRQFNVTPSFFTVTQSAEGQGAQASRRRSGAANAASNAAVANGTLDVKQQLTQRGVEFSAEGSNAIYLASSGVLEVVNTQDQMDLIDELVNAETGQTMMVDIEARFVEIKQTDLNELSSNIALYPLNGSTITTPTFVSSMRGSAGLSAQQLQSLLLQAQPSAPGRFGPSAGSAAPIENTLALGGIMDGKHYSAVLRGLSQKTSADLLSAPYVRVRSGERAKIDATRTFYYPTQYNPPQIITITTGTSSISTTPLYSPPAAIPAFPSSFDKQDIGVVLNIQPTVGGDNRTIDLSLVPEITDFEGFINYGDPITVSDGVSTTPVVLVANQILQPVFNVRRVSTKVFLKDGFTVVLGGLIREDSQTINDKVPVLGDIPLVGRFFQSKVKQNVKRNLLIFVTGKILRPDGERFNQTTTDVASADAAR